MWKKSEIYGEFSYLKDYPVNGKNQVGYVKKGTSLGELDFVTYAIDRMYDLRVRMGGRDFFAQLLDMAVDGAGAYYVLGGVVYTSTEPISL